MKKKYIRVIILFSIIMALFFLTGEKGLVQAKIQGYKALKVFEHVRTSDLTYGYNNYETEHFIIRYKPNDESNIKPMARLLEDSYTLVGLDYNHFPEGKTTVFLYETQQALWDSQKAISGQAVMGVYNMGVIHILSPDAYNYAQYGGKEAFMEYFEKNGPILHEYVHKVIDDLTQGNIELWLTEGLALYAEYTINGIEWQPGLTYKTPYNSAEIRNHFMRLNSDQSYRQCFDMIKKLVDEHGREKMGELLETLKQGNSMDKAFMEVYGMSANAFINSMKGSGVVK